MENELTIRDRFVGIGDETSDLKGCIQTHLEGAAESGGDMDYYSHAVRCYERTEKLEQALEVIQDELEELVEEFGADAPKDRSRKTTTGSRKIQVQITQGMINQKYLSLTQAKKAGIVKVGDSFKIHVGDGIVVETCLINPGNKFQNRTFVQSVFEKHGAEAGDYIELEEQEDHSWTMQYRNQTEAEKEISEEILRRVMKDEL